MSYPEKYSIRNSHSLSFDWKSVERPADIFPIHANIVQVNRAACYPALPPDNSIDLVNETFHRRNFHEESLLNNKDTFRRQESEATKFQQDLVKLGVGKSIHILKDPFDKRTYTYSKVANPVQSEVEFPARDFSFSSPIQSRTTGYSTGHIRSITRMDTIGPNDSKNRQELEGSGMLPKSWNIDRHLSAIPSHHNATNGLKTTSNLELKPYTCHEKAVNYHLNYTNVIKVGRSWQLRNLFASYSCNSNSFDRIRKRRNCKKR
jgi:hypothetical protein